MVYVLKSMILYRVVFYIVLIPALIFITASGSLASENSGSVFQGYITNKSYSPIKLRVFGIDPDSLYTLERNLENNSFVPSVDLMITAESTQDYSVVFDDKNIFIPKSTKFIGSINEIIPPKSFNRVGFYKISFDEVICPDGQSINLMSKVTSSSTVNSYNPVRHLGKTTLSLIGGSLAGTLFAYNLSGIGLTIASHGYSLAAGAAAGGFIGAASGAFSKGKPSSIQPGNDLTIVPVNETSLNELSQIVCMASEKIDETEVAAQNNVNIEVLSVKKKKDIIGENALKVMLKITNNSDENYHLSNFFLRDSQGKEYASSAIDLNSDVFESFPPKETKTTWIEFFVDYPKTSHWLVLKNLDYTKEIGVWKVKG